MRVPTRPVAEALEAPRRVASSAGTSSGVSNAAIDPDYIPQFKITKLPVIPAKELVSRIGYPLLAAKQGIEAIVYLELFIDGEGRIRKISVLKDPGFGFAGAATAALRGIACAPAEVDGRTVAVPRHALRRLRDARAYPSR
jgi:protein TonB